ncbi:hypothetical protein C2S53_010902 [Perilla frutescens var. hirtella]|uniref:Uncharacterized protein n=1 Tax=Perilla frutescens var. hirtella TaxID=608512 RepID=A0AAD4J0F7_PERFH|nr:hypothetical protein C2S53_010902 [Perilla frutescens var. hirtella]
MKGHASKQGELTSIAYLDKKRKVQDEQLEMPFPKQVCRDQHPDRGPSMESGKEPMKVECDEFAKGGESEPESTNSNSFHGNSDCFMCADDEAKTDPDCPETQTSDEPSTSSASWASTSSGTGLYSSENRSSIDPSTSEPDSLSVSEGHDCPDQQDGMHVGESGCDADLGFSVYGHAKIEHYTDKELEDLLYSNGVPPGSSYILSSGRSVNQGAEAQQEVKKKLTIDKEFEQYFSTLML